MSQNTNSPEKSILGQKYRVVVLDDDTLAEVRSTRLSGGSLVAGLIAAILLVGLLSTLLICYTPLRYLVPGYADVTNNMAYMDLTRKLDEIEVELDVQRTYTQGMMNLLNPSGIKSEESLERIGKEQLDNGDFIDHFYFRRPLKGEISAPFNPSEKHFGVDIVSQSETPVQAILDGVIINTAWSEENGNTISVQHKNDLVSIFKHNASLLKKVGQKVKTGEAIAIIGNTGDHTSGPHVHFELWSQGVPVDPTEYIEF